MLQNNHDLGNKVVNKANCTNVQIIIAKEDKNKWKSNLLAVRNISELYCDLCDLINSMFALQLFL